MKWKLSATDFTEINIQSEWEMLFALYPEIKILIKQQNTNVSYLILRGKR
jgi:hypothetical protein